MTPVHTAREALEAAAKVAHDLALQSGDDITKGAAVCIEQAIRAIPVAEAAPDPLTARLVEALRFAYGLLWHMRIDTSDDNLKLASDARNALLAVMSKDDQFLGIDAAKMTDARFTGAA